MARHETRIWLECTKMIGLLCLVSSILLQHGASGQRVKVEPEVSSYPGQTVNLRCAFTDPTGVQLSMVTWMYVPEPSLDPVNIAVFLPGNEPSYPDSPVKGRVSFVPSPPNMASPSIQITNVRITDEGKYACEFATYPGGNVRGTTQLVMLAKPENSASAVRVVAGTKPVAVAQCQSANGRPAAEISWATAASGNYTTKSKTETNNTVTVTSQYIMVPTPNDNGKDINCIVSHRTLVKPENFKMKLEVEYPPQVSIVGYDNNWYMGRTNVELTCQASANPSPTSVLWKSITGDLPATVEQNENVLKVLKVDETVNATFICEVANRIGTVKEQVAILVRVNPLPMKGPTTGSIIGAIIGVIILIAIIGTVIALCRKRADRMHGDGPPKYKPPPPKKANKTTNSAHMLLNSSHTPVIHDDYYSTPEPVTDLDAYQEENVDFNGGRENEVHYMSAAPSRWDDPENNEVPPPYMQINSDHQDHHPVPNIGRGESFVSSAMFV
ncbi:nectin-2-like isoform X2 [Archocentrus centrarchus]|uniref:nectin-2-like isoform X2 n=1 Tax=Archocentrus centrarchus TaxID=63155 RepID=UPI0011EA09B8|nr:nectin-2-like isoform X2 [Archocentrus centrarchus]